MVCLSVLITHCQPCKGATVRDPFWGGLSQAVQWYGILQVKLEMQVNDIIHRC